MRIAEVEDSICDTAFIANSADVTEADYVNASHRWNLRLDEIVELVTISEWFDSVKASALETGDVLPDDETLVLIIRESARTAELMQRTGKFSTEAECEASMGNAIAHYCAELGAHTWPPKRVG